MYRVVSVLSWRPGASQAGHSTILSIYLSIYPPSCSLVNLSIILHPGDNIHYILAIAQRCIFLATPYTSSTCRYHPRPQIIHTHGACIHVPSNIDIFIIEYNFFLLCVNRHISGEEFEQPGLHPWLNCYLADVYALVLSRHKLDAEGPLVLLVDHVEPRVLAWFTIRWLLRNMCACVQ